jgi:tRNA pseudouridine55 synthase
VGHAGTLDPLATGVLIVCLGPATRLVEYLHSLPKRYLATFLLGKSSDTEDIEGRVVDLPHPPCPTREQVEAVLTNFVGAVAQRPPAYSALKVAGARAYDLARQGQAVDLAARPVTIHEIGVRGYEYPELRLDVLCGSGTYIRSLGRDIAQLLGTAAVMSALQRTAIGSFRIEDACRLDDLSRESLSRYLLPPRLAVSHLPVVAVTLAETQRLSLGQPIADRWQIPAGEIAALDATGNLVSILGPQRAGWLQPLRNFPSR